MQKLVVVLGVIFTCLLINGCQYSDLDSKKEPADDSQNIMLTEAEEKLLCELYINEERIKEGKLYDYQLKCLEQIRYAMEYLNNKYPNENFEILICNPKNKMNSMTTIMFYEGRNREELYDLYITESDEGYRAEDNYYGVLIREEYDTELTNILRESGFEKCLVYTAFNEVHDESVNGELTAEDIFKLGNQLGRGTDIFIDYDPDKSELLVSQLKEIMENQNLYGSYIVYIKSGIADMGMSAEEAKEYMRTKEARENTKVVCFNCFDI